MALTLPASFETELLKPNPSFEYAYELRLASGTKYYAAQSFTWDSKSWVAMSIGHSPIRQNKDVAKVDECRVTFSNVTLALQAEIGPTDKLSGREILIHWLMRDGNGDLLPDGVVLFRGWMQRPERVNQNAIEVQCFDLVGGTNIPIGRKLSGYCQAVFKDGIDCTYAGPENTCDRQFTGDCATYGNQHEFLGFTGYDETQRGRRFRIPADEVFNTIDYGYGYPNWTGIYDARFRQAVRSSRGPNAIVPIVFGRRAVKGQLVERHQHDQPGFTGGQMFDVQIHGLAEGPCDIGAAVVTIPDNYFVTAQRSAFVGDDRFNGTVGPGNRRESWIYWAPGDIGIDADGPLDYGVNTTSPSVIAQNRHYLSEAEHTYSRTCYAIVVQGPVEIDGEETDYTEQTITDFMIRGRLLQTTVGGVLDAVEWSRNPVWQIRDLIRSNRYGLGRAITEAMIDSASFEAPAAACAATRYTTESQTTITSATVQTFFTGYPHLTPIYILEVNNGSGINILDEIEINGDSGNRHIVYSVSQNSILLYTDPGAVQVGWTVGVRSVAKPSDIVFDKPEAPNTAFSKILGVCFGFITYDEEGRIQLKMEQLQGTPVAHYRDIGFGAGRAIFPSTFQWKAAELSGANQMIVRYKSDLDDLELSEASTDWDSVSVIGVNPVEKEYPAVQDRDLAREISAVELAKLSEAETGGSFDIGPYGFRHQPGDVIEATHDVPNWNQEPKIIERIDKHANGKVTVHVADYDAAWYSPGVDVVPPDRPPLPTVTLTAYQRGNEKVVLRWTVPSGARVHQWELHRSPVSIAEATNATTRIETFPPAKRRFEYEIRPDELNSTLYFVLRCHLARGIAISNEVSVAVSAAQADSDINLVVGGDFHYAEDWELQAPTENIISPASGVETDHPGDDAGLTDTANAYDGDTATVVSGTFNQTTAYTEGTNFGFGTGNRSGFLRIAEARVDNQIRNIGALRAYHNVNGGETLWAEVTDSLRQERRSEYLGTVAMPGLVCGVRSGITTEKETGAFGQVFFGELQFVELSGDYWSYIGNNVLTLQTVGSEWAEARRGFPGYRPTRVNVALRAGADYWARIALKRGSAEIDGNVEVLIYDGVQEHLVLRIGPSNYSLVGSDWTHFGVRFRPSADITSTATEIIVRSRSTKAVDVDKLGLFPGPSPKQWVPAAEEQTSGYFGDLAQGTPPALKPVSGDPDPENFTYAVQS